MEQHKRLVRDGMELLNQQVREVLLEEHPLPSVVSVPYHDEESGKWVRLSLKISPMRDIGKDVEFV